MMIFSFKCLFLLQQKIDYAQINNLEVVYSYRLKLDKEFSYVKEIV